MNLWRRCIAPWIWAALDELEAGIIDRIGMGIAYIGVGDREIADCCPGGVFVNRAVIEPYVRGGFVDIVYRNCKTL